MTPFAKSPATPSDGAVCPVTGETTSAAAMVECVVCQQHVAPRAVQSGRCLACRSLEKVRKDDPRMARVLYEHPRLDNWSRWRMGETATVYVLVASRLSGKLLVVLNKETLDPLRVAESGPFFTRWSDLPAVQRDAELR